MENNKKPSEGAGVVTGPSHGPQGVDKAPGEEVPAKPDQFIQETQKGKKNDGDPTLEEDKPSTQASI